MTEPELPEQPQILSVSELNKRARGLLEQELAKVWVEGEVSNLAMPASGHWYFTLKDDAGQIRCAMFRNRNAFQRTRPANGQHLVVRGGVSLYVARGDFQLIVEHIEDAGEGRLQREFLQLKAKLAADGLFDEEIKKSLPVAPRHVAVITSPSGAAIRDFLSVFARRFPLTQISIVPVSVQGDAAAPQIRSAIEAVNRCAATLDPPIDVVVLTRGGGSLEDLWPFNVELVARAIHASDLPVVSAVGHESDFSIADLAADLRAATPSAAAMLLSPDSATMFDALQSVEEKLNRTMRRQLARVTEKIGMLSRRLRNPAGLLREQAQRLDELEQRVQRGMQQQLHLHRQNCTALDTRLHSQQPGKRLLETRKALDLLADRGSRALDHRLSTYRQQLANFAQLLEAVSPLATLGRGYSIATDAQGQVLRDATQVAPNSEVALRLAKGRLQCRVEASLPTQEHGE